MTHQVWDYIFLTLIWEFHLVTHLPCQLWQICSRFSWITKVTKPSLRPGEVMSHPVEHAWVASIVRNRAEFGAEFGGNLDLVWFRFKGWVRCFGEFGCNQSILIFSEFWTLTYKIVCLHLMFSLFSLPFVLSGMVGMLWLHHSAKSTRCRNGSMDECDKVTPHSHGQRRTGGTELHIAPHHTHKATEPLNSTLVRKCQDVI